MLTKLVRIQVVIFTVIGLLGVSYVGAQYAGLGSIFGASGYTVKVRLTDSGGIFTGAEVTYRGVAIGRVGELRLTDSGVEVDANITDDDQKVPDDLDAVVTNRSAVGEQYLDLRPRRDGEPYLTEGSTVDSRRTALPLPVETVLLNLDRLVESVPKDKLRTVVDELHLATQGTGPALQALLDESARLTKVATTHLPQTTRLLVDAGLVLDTQIQVSDAIKSFATNSKLIAEQLRRSDGDLRGLIKTGPEVAKQVTAVLSETGPNLGALMANLVTTSTVLLARQGGMEQLLITAPAAVDAASNVIRADGAHFGLATTFFDPMPCVYGSTRYRNGLDTSPAPFNTNARC
ncbi:phospholipid/cholesterol/gamma-HCH transport system substrate-binding protein [Herbihabitans rhizosphaerae]|uniref:Phospholipid/cholesterol/gamma-HCH transport system substrate-binding protein n=1 Tax=Herbihabitans rhizosphaerae TaxID=1872711 RepID=A0A4Q7KAR1_9PSEU|nr:MlaD family protein [Herbihabitans rhizosphaerae]RZS29433.1 phospholipid/cholesterol/gamma-HCH transport system substrate-binding protein [Herbihabitans rhizosphaerae]